MAQLASFKVPNIDNEPLVRLPQHLVLHTDGPQRNYAPGSAEREGLDAALSKMQQELPFEVPCVINGKPVSSRRSDPPRTGAPTDNLGR